MKFLVAIFRPNHYDHATEITQEVMADIDRVNEEMIDAGVCHFVGGLKSTCTSRSIDRDDAGFLTIKEGPFLESSHFVDGFWVLELPGMEEAVEWGKKAATACRGSVEVRPFY